MRALEFITEAKGMFGRKHGDPFTNDNGQTAQFAGVEMYPDTKPGNAYKDAETTKIAVDRIESRMGVEIQWVNRQKPQSNAFAIATMKTDDDQIMLWGRWFKTVPANIIGSWSNNEIPQGWLFTSKTAKKARSGLTPQDLIRSEIKFTTSDQIIEAISANGAPQEIIDGLRMAALGTMPVFKNSRDKLESIRDHLGEIITPIALMSGLISDTSSDNAKTEILKNDWDKCTIYWPQAKNNNLVDSEFMSSNGSIIGISNKGDKGAYASVNNIYDAMIAPKNKVLRDNNKRAVNIVEIIQKESAKEGPIKLGIKLGLIDQYLGDEIKLHIEKKENDPSSLSENAKRLFVEFGSKSNSPGYNVGLVLLANCAKKVAHKLNEDDEFQKSCMAFMNQASILQVYTDAKASGNDVVISSFRSIYPPKFTGKLRIDAGKNYTSTIVKGKFSFDIGKGQE